MGRLLSATPNALKGTYSSGRDTRQQTELHVVKLPDAMHGLVLLARFRRLVFDFEWRARTVIGLHLMVDGLQLSDAASIIRPADRTIECITDS